MEEIYLNVKYDKSVKQRPSANQTAPRSSERSFHGAVVLFLGLLNILLVAGLVGLGVHYYGSIQQSAAELSNMTANLTERLQSSDNKFSSLTEERDLLNASLIEMTQELSRLSTCPAGWTKFSCACYLLSNESGSWEKAEEDCRGRGAELVVIHSTEEQRFLSNFTEEETLAWIGLTDRDKEGTWIWIDGAPLTLKYWRKAQPDNGGGHQRLGQEDCAHIIGGGNDLKNWNDLSCNKGLRWICEKMV